MTLIEQDYVDIGPVDLRHGSADLNGDGSEEWVVFVSGFGICGSGGCPLWILSQTGNDFETIGKLSITQIPIGYYAEKTKGWHDLAVSIGGGGLPNGTARIPFDGESYARNPTVAPASLGSDEFTVLINSP